MKWIRQFFRLLYINYILLRYRIDKVVLSTDVMQPYHFLSYLNPWNWFKHPSKRRGESIRLALISLGPIFVKFGQILSTRRDLLPDDVTEELEKLLDQVPPFSGYIAKEIIESTFQKSITELFAEFNLEPLASASIAQVHEAVLHDGRKVVVKVVRPNIKKVIRRDVGLLYSVATLTEYFLPHGRRLRPRDVVKEFEHSILYELDLMHEASNASQLRRNFLGSTLLYVPEIFWDYTRTNIMVMEKIEGIPVTDIPALKEKNINLKRLAEKGVEIFFTQVFRDSFFHADMHSGNIFVAEDHPEDPRYLAVDFGIMGILSPKDQRYIAENLLAFFHRDYRRVAMLHVESGWVTSDIREDEFEAAIRGVCEPIFERPLKDISFGKILLRLFQTAGRFHMEIQPQLVLLQKTLVNIEGLGRQLYPNLDLWSTAKPYLEKWLRQKMGLKNLFKRIYDQSPYWLEKSVEVPDLIYTILQTKKVNEFALRDRLLKKSRKTKRINTTFLLGFGFGFVVLALLNYLQNFRWQHQWMLPTILVGLMVMIFALVLRSRPDI